MAIDNEINLNMNPLDNTVITGSISDFDTDDVRTITEILMRQSPQPRRKGYSISLYLPAVRDPIELWNLPIITIGRRDQRRSLFPIIDLSEHHAAKLGVSRLHAQIVFMNGGFYVTDLDSRNGTWVNKSPVLPGQFVPLTHRDMLRIGHFIIHVGACQYS